MYARYTGVRIPLFNTAPGIRGFHTAHEARDQALHRLSTGKRINRGADDPSGVITTEKMETDLVVLERRLKSFEHEKSSLSIQEGAHSVQADLLQELLGLVVNAGNRAGLSEAELDAMQIEADSILEGFDKISTDTRFKGDMVIKNYNSFYLGRVAYQAEIEDDGSDEDPDAGSGDDPDAELPDPDLDPGAPSTETQWGRLAELRSNGKFSLRSGNLEEAEQSVRSAIESISTRRASIGARMNSIDSEAGAIQAEHENLSAAVSQVRDADFAQETAEFIRASILEQASLSAIEIGRHSADSVMDLLESSVELAKQGSR